MLGTVGHLLILIAFVSCALAGFAFLQASLYRTGASDWQRIGRATWSVTAFSMTAAYAILLVLFLTHRFEYALVFQHTSLEQPLKYLISATWAGQEGSFMLWIVFTAFFGLVLTRTAGDYEAPVMTVFSVCLFFLISMVVGLQIGSLPIGANPFALLREVQPDLPVWQTQPNFVPLNGNGLNDLLMNPWMAIHPPTIFVGFSAMLAPFAFAVAALWRRRYTDWVARALPWTLFSVMILGVGIAMGGYWAYVTLSFGGYWAWDPVENSSLAPWMIGVAAIHTMIAQKKSGYNHKAALFLVILAFMLCVYSTFLTRSGILGDISVHSFVDLGLSNQLLVWILVMGVVGFGLFALRYRELPTPRREPNALSREFLIFSGAMLFSIAAAVILLGTSAPIFGRIFRDNPAAVPLEFYNKWTLPLAVGFTFLIGLGQLFWWQKMRVADVNRVILKPLALSVASTLAVLVLTPFAQTTVQPLPAAPAAASATAEAGMLAGLGDFWAAYGYGLLMLMLLFAAFFALYGNGAVLWKIARGNLKLAGGAISHIGFVLAILGIIASSGFSNPLAAGRGVQIGDTRENFIIERGQTRTVEGYQVTYTGQERTAEGYTSYVLDFQKPDGREFTLNPIVYKSNRDQWIQHPDVKLYFERDIYAAVTPSVMFERRADAPGSGELTLAKNDSTVIGEGRFAVHFLGFNTDVDVSQALDPATLDSLNIAVAADLEVTDLTTGEQRLFQPVYMIMQDRTQQFLQTRAEDWDVSFTFAGMDVNNGQIRLVVEGVDVMPNDWIVVQAYEKPFINVLWLGILILSGGFVLSMVRRIGEDRFRRQRAAAA